MKSEHVVDNPVIVCVCVCLCCHQVCKRCIKSISEIIFPTLSDCVTWFNFSRRHFSLLHIPRHYAECTRHYINEYAHEDYGIGRLHLLCVRFLLSCNLTVDIFGTFPHLRRQQRE